MVGENCQPHGTVSQGHEVVVLKQPRAAIVLHMRKFGSRAQFGHRYPIEAPHSTGVVQIVSRPPCNAPAASTHSSQNTTVSLESYQTLQTTGTAQNKRFETRTPAPLITGVPGASASYNSLELYANEDLHQGPVTPDQAAATDLLNYWNPPSESLYEAWQTRIYDEIERQKLMKGSPQTDTVHTTAPPTVCSQKSELSSLSSITPCPRAYATVPYEYGWDDRGGFGLGFPPPLAAVVQNGGNIPIKLRLKDSKFSDTRTPLHGTSGAAPDPISNATPCSSGLLGLSEIYNGQTDFWEDFVNSMLDGTRRRLDFSTPSGTEGSKGSPPSTPEKAPYTWWESRLALNPGAYGQEYLPPTLHAVKHRPKLPQWSGQFCLPCLAASAARAGRRQLRLSRLAAPAASVGRRQLCLPRLAASAASVGRRLRA